MTLPVLLLADYFNLASTSKTIFNPIDPALLKDPELVDLSEEEHETKIKEVRHGHIMKALTFIREPIKFSVARTLQHLGTTHSPNDGNTATIMDDHTNTSGNNACQTQSPSPSSPPPNNIWL
ncbi:hypothetical protein BDC45DRAFT_564164 [Circinella umbellata]|nr:hypothetical protein BDC45DRAFT_564164 [Circinella umbellata]